MERRNHVGVSLFILLTLLKTIFCDCPALDSTIDNGSIISTTGTATGNRVTYKCYTGYVMSAGSPTRLCLPSGTWSGTEPTCVTEASEHNGCSFHGYDCHISADCVDINIETNEWECRCPDGVEGDGLNGPNNTGCGNPTCQDTLECHPRATCNSITECECSVGYEGDGWDMCNNIDECAKYQPCSSDARCVDNEGSWTCTCKAGYTGDGYACLKSCSRDSHCTAANEKCGNDGRCECKAGFVRNDALFCVDIPECDDSPCNGNASCQETEGSYICTCNEGYSGNGVQCTVMPRCCHEIKMANPSAGTGRYMINVDGTGPLQAVEVTCKMRTGYGITSIRPTYSGAIRVTTKLIHYTYEISVLHIKALTAISGFCKQGMNFKGKYGAVLMDDEYWVDGNGQTQLNWGGATIAGMCPCGQMGYCKDVGASCNNNGASETRNDGGMIYKKEDLPIVEVYVNAKGGSSARADILIESVMCSKRPFDVPLDCDDAKFKYYEKISGPQLIDVDGPEGSLDPILVHCDMTTYKHLGITVIPHTTRDAVEASVSGEVHTFDYVVDNETAIYHLINASTFCTQSAEYACRNSRLLNSGIVQGYFSDLAGSPKQYWPGGMGGENQCSCSLTGSCRTPSGFGCNCDSMDDSLKKDFGEVTDKSHLPIGSVTFNEVGGADQYGQFKVGPLKCGMMEFGIPPTCQGYADDGVTESATYQIDPDGPKNRNNPDPANQDPFPAECRFYSSPAPYAETRINHQHMEEMELIGIGYQLHYFNVLSGQLTVLTGRSVTCTQSFRFMCVGSPIYVSGTYSMTWNTLDNRIVSYFSSDGTVDACECGLLGTCDGSGLCNCDINDMVQRNDSGLLTQKLDLPMMQLNYNVHNAYVQIGPLVCTEIFPTCAAHKEFHRLDTERRYTNGYYTIDPDGVNIDGVKPFRVKCSGPVTDVRVRIAHDGVITSNSNTATQQCFQVYYSDYAGNTISSEQIMALIAVSDRCAQRLRKTCLSAGISGNTYYRTCDNQTQTGWSSSRGRPMCACGVVGSCAGGLLCNCDLQDGIEREDGEWIVDKDRVGVWEVCDTLQTASGTNGEPTTRKASIFVSHLYCSNEHITDSVARTCQEQRNRKDTDSRPILIDPDLNGPIEPTPYQCTLTNNPPIGCMELLPYQKDVVVPSSGIDIDIGYHVYNMSHLLEVIGRSDYCEQEIFLDCMDAELTLGASNGLYSRTGSLLNYWSGNEDGMSGTPGCAGGQCKCNLSGQQTDGGKVIDKSVLPITRIKLGPSTGNRVLRIRNMKCCNLPVDCDEIDRVGPKSNTLHDHTYAIDPDQGGGEDAFAVTCDFYTDWRMGITVISPILPVSTEVVNMSTTVYEQVIEYKAATIAQTRKLIAISGYCFQRITYSCLDSPVSPSYGYSGFDGQMSTGYGNGVVNGCSCQLLGSCPTNETCHCDEQNGIETREYGYVTDHEVLPISKVTFGGQYSPEAVANYDITNLRCGPSFFGFPADCSQAYTRGFLSGEVMIRPRSTVDPFLVYCDMSKGIGIAVLGHDRMNSTTVIFGEEMIVTYKNTERSQVVALTYVSKYCYQPMKYQCVNTKLQQDEYVMWINNDEINECPCGGQDLCGGSEDKSTLMNLDRACNCDTADDQWRSDAGILGDPDFLPVYRFHAVDPERQGALGMITFGYLYCSDSQFEVDACALGFHDCDPQHAQCIFKSRVSFDCECMEGWEGLGVPDVWANGRNCHDDDECALDLCPHSATCTNTPGSFTCTCNAGYTQTGPTTCEDINECEVGNPCDEHATCFNMVGSFFCRCRKRGYHGDGFQCTLLGECSCFGDPHCNLYDGTILHYQGQCEYIMTRDVCDDLSQTPNFEVLANFEERDMHSRHGVVTWVNSVTFKYQGIIIDLMQERIVHIGGEKVTLPYMVSNIDIRDWGNYLEVYTADGIIVTWDGDQFVKVQTPVGWQNKTCGLCGNYNGDAADDLTIGPACLEDEGTITDNHVVFGNSWVTPASADGDDTCMAVCDAPPETNDCTDEEEMFARAECNKIFDLNGAFKDTLITIDTDVIASHFESCVYDMCHLDEDTSIVLCRVLGFIIRHCQSESQAAVQIFIEDASCDNQCGDNMEFVACVSNTDITCRDILAGLSVEDNLDIHTAGCFCRLGFVRDGDKCIEEDNCGCLDTMDGNEVYYSVGTEVALSGCQKKKTCGVNHAMTITNIVCHENATCTVKYGRHGCHCVDDMYGNGIECFPDRCLENPCGVSETCNHFPETPPYYSCRCSIGYQGDVGNCSDTDECTEGTNDCPDYSNCENTDGSFVCVCISGYQMSGHICEDIDECSPSMDTAICSETSRCSNTNGGYECICCQGYSGQMNDDQEMECLRTNNTATVDQPYCCICDMETCDLNGQVCGLDGVTYDSRRDMILAMCEARHNSSMWENVQHYGPCQQTCSPDPCPMYQACSMQDGVPTCACDECTENDTNSDTVCDSRMNIYVNLCLFKRAQCNNDWEGDPFSDDEVCHHNHGMGPWSVFGNCSASCGPGNRTRTRQPHSDLTQEQLAAFHSWLEDTKPCNEGVCPVDGNWGTWDTWTTWSTTCGPATRSRSRLCDNPAPAHNGANCTGSETETENTTLTPCPVDGNWGTWDTWTTWSTTCGPATRSKSRLCDNPAPAHNGANCTGSETETENTTLTPCPVDGNWGTWDTWTTWSTTCGPATRSKSRLCDSPAPAHNGANCTGSETETENTTLTPCPVDGNWGTWDTWTTWSTTCGPATRSKSRLCDNPAPAHNGANCTGSETETENTTLTPCPVDGNWGTWDTWTTWSTTCGPATRSRSRLCDNPAPAHNGANCTGSETETENTTLTPCPVDGNWGTWDTWTTWSTTCGPATRSRSRLCDNPAPAHNGANCTGSETETENTTLTPCPEDGNWGTWDTWTTWSTTCGPATMSRSRLCDSPAPAHNGANCTGSETETENTTLNPCPVDGNWGTWDTWTTWSTTCGPATRSRSRLCDNPPPAHNGANCTGSETETENTTLTPCPVDGNWGTWDTWTTWSTTCGPATRSRSRLCDNPAPAHNGANCTGSETETENTTLTPCPEDGNWGTWDTWTTWSTTCGPATMSRSRLCDSPAPAHNGANCTGSETETENTTLNPCPVDGNWGTWDTWTTWSTTCGPATRSKSRLCDNPAPAHNGANCTGSETETENITLTPCPVDGNWGTWDTWTTWSTTCGPATRSRYRLCDNPAPAHNGTNCTGSSMETENTTFTPCPVDGNWGTWDTWTDWSTTCGPATRSRFRLCDNPAPAHNGTNCTGSETETENTTVTPCPVDGNWGTWGDWTSWSATCGPVTTTRYRSCDNPSPAYAGATCSGNDTETDSNILPDCPVNECEDGTHNCDDNAECTDTDDSFYCTCSTGYGGDGTVCEDIDECGSGGTANCHEHAYCTNTGGSFICTCHQGYFGDGTYCHVSDCEECDDDWETIITHEVCHPVTYTCDCADGYTRKSDSSSDDDDCRKCVDVDECAESRYRCVQNAECINTQGSYMCKCIEGYKFNGLVCEDEIECGTQVTGCHDKAICKDIPGHRWYCECPKGYDGDGHMCTDIDECGTGKADCDTNAKCEDAFGTYVCECKPGFEGSGRSGDCTDVKECELGLDGCDPNASCMDDCDGSYTCTCNEGYYGDGYRGDCTPDDSSSHSSSGHSHPLSGHRHASPGKKHSAQGDVAVGIDNIVQVNGGDTDVNINNIVLINEGSGISGGPSNRDTSGSDYTSHRDGGHGNRRDSSGSDQSHGHHGRSSHSSSGYGRGNYN